MEHFFLKQNRSKISFGKFVNDPFRFSTEINTYSQFEYF